MLDVALLTEPLLSALLTLPSADPVPEPEDVRAGWVALAVFGGLALAVLVLAISLVRQLRKAQRAKETGVYGDEPTVAEEPPTDDR